jgi:hypothetical protein
MLYTLYRSPLDYPGMYVLRRFALEAGSVAPRATADVLTAPEPEQLRGLMRARGLFCVPRSPDDHPNVVESWL